MNGSPILADNVDESSCALIAINGTIVSAKDFDSCNCCVCYYMEGDKEWHFAQAGQSCLFGSTPKCVADSGDVCFFSNPFQVYLKLDANTDWSNVRPILYLKVLSFSFQNFLTSESFGLLEIPITRGRHSFAINTWKPFVRNRLQLMRQYFMGCVPVAHQMNLDSTLIDNKYANNYSLEAESSGQVVLDLDVVVQAETRGCDQMTRDKYKMANPSVDSIKQNVLSVVLAFQRARRRMQALKGQLDSSFML